MKSFNTLFVATVFTLISLPTAYAGSCPTQAQGSYIGSIGNEKNIRFNFLCIDENRPAMSLYGLGSGFNASLLNSSVKDDTLILALFPLDGADRKTVTAGSVMTYVRLNLPSLLNGTLTGLFINDHLTAPLEIAATRVQKIPDVSNVVNVNPSMMRGTYTMTGANKQALTFWLDDLDGTPFVTLDLKGSADLHLIDGTPWNGHGQFSVANTFGDDMRSGETLFQFRASALSNHSLQVYLIEPQYGVIGPLVATKVSSPLRRR